jgi:chitin deacetylase
MYTSDLLDLLDEFNAKATFFITGVNSGKGQIDDFTRPWGSLIQRMHRSGHQIASHSWSHQDLSNVTPAQRRDEMVKNEAAIRNILGGIPAYMRPPYSSCVDGSGCRRDMNLLGYHVIYFDIDTDDYNNDDPNLIQRSKDIFDKAISTQDPSGRPFLAIAHDVHEQTVYNLTAHILQRTEDAGYRAVTVGECLDDPKDYWYRWDLRSM